MPPILYLFAVANLVIGTGAFALSGILQPIAESLGVSVSAAGQAMTAYALTSALIAPLLLVATGRWPRRNAILLALGLFAAGSIVSALAGSFAMLLAGRVLMGAGSMFTALVAGLAVALAPPGQQGKALSLTFLGMSLSYVIGLPLGTWMGFHYGWQSPIWIVVAYTLLTMLAMALMLPATVSAGGASFAGASQVFRQWPVLRVWLRSLLYFIAIFCVFAYIGPVMQALNPLTPTQLSLTLMVFGLSGVAGTISGGWASDKYGPLRCVRVQLSLFSLAIFLVPWTLGSYPLTVLVFVVWGICGFGMMAPQQTRLATLAPTQAPLLFSLNSSMLYLGTALGAVIGGAALPLAGAAYLPWVGLPFALAALATLWPDFAGPRPRAAPP